MDITRLNTKRVAMKLINNIIKHAFLSLGYAVATRNQDKVVCEFLQDKDAFVSLPTGDSKSLCFTTLPGVFGYLKHLTVSSEKLSAELCCWYPHESLQKLPASLTTQQYALPSDFRQWL